MFGVFYLKNGRELKGIFPDLQSATDYMYRRHLEKGLCEIEEVNVVYTSKEL